MLGAEYGGMRGGHGAHDLLAAADRCKASRAMTIASHAARRDETRKGVLYALTAYVLWGFYGLFFGALGHIDGLELIAHRAFWSVPVAVIALWAFGSLTDLAPILADRRLMAREALQRSAAASKSCAPCPPRMPQTFPSSSRPREKELQAGAGAPSHRSL